MTLTEKLAHLRQALETIALHAPSLDASGVREIADGALAHIDIEISPAMMPGGMAAEYQRET